MLQLANSDKYLCINEWQGATQIHVRNYFKSDSGQLIPTKKGIALTIEEWKALKAYVDHIDAMIAFSEDERILGRKSGQMPPSPPYQLQSLIPEECQAKPPSAEAITKQLLQIRNATPYPQLHEPEPFDR